MMIPTTLLQAILATLVAGWSGEVLEPPLHETAIKIYYDSHASENNGHCKAPYIDDFHMVEVVEDNAEQLVVETRYRYRDGLKDRQAWRIGPGRSACVASNSRRFVLVKSAANLRVASMSLPQLG
jgi:hypothetical protein